ncbi:DUF2550 family protein [Yimella sp. cx-51]|uniref:DUF2550 family protein n=1 Tax=Yimella sp. cx-51 TaxID=2770551 RepID=UPI00165D66E9|nr:DUF2550 family protein [Yimella sp. cx-51]MBC9957036.1 DUF2550 family protein [Yimella sp. cx-51]MBD2758343.1 DUF2550 family protein [Yimella sp. cx-573]QTH37298.1 DUF2550 family protein [Yimella sp. cx-51]
MGDVLLTAEVVVGVLCTLVVLLVAWVVLRRWLITKHHLMILMARRRGDLWVMGMARTTPTAIEWFPVLGLRLTPRIVLHRDAVEVGPPISVDRPMHALPDPVAVDCTTEETTLRFMVSRNSYTQVRSWSESSPPGLNTGRY